MFTKFRKRFIAYFTNKQNWISNLKTLAILAVVFIGITHYQQRNMSQGTAPAIGISEHGQLTEVDYSKGPTLVYFWGSWCPICKTTSPSVSTLAEEGKYQIISIALSSGSNEDIKSYQDEHGYKFTTINDDSGKISKQWGVAVTPSIFYVDTEGEITAISTGMTSLWGMRFRLWSS